MKKDKYKNFFRFEHKSEPLLPIHLFVRRLFKHISIGIISIFVALLIGVLGYHIIEGFNWIDSLLNASMILGGMGPVGELHTNSGKFFASMYALFSGIFFLVTVGMVLAHVVHRFLHNLHINDLEETDKNL